MLISSLLLGLIFVGWQPLPLTVWAVPGGLAEIVLTALYWVGWLIVLLSTFMISHFELFGLTQVWRRLRGRPMARASFKEAFLYRFVRHPIMLGFLIAFWCTPVMTLGHLLFALLTTGYILVGVQLEEHDLLAAFGAAYASYRKRVPMLIPFLTRPSARPGVRHGADRATGR